MEFCGGSTLRDVIDKNFFCADADRRVPSQHKKVLIA